MNENEFRMSSDVEWDWWFCPDNIYKSSSDLNPWKNERGAGPLPLCLHSSWVKSKEEFFDFIGKNLEKVFIALKELIDFVEDSKLEVNAAIV